MARQIVTLAVKVRFTNREISQLWGDFDAVRNRSPRDHGDEIYVLSTPAGEVRAVIATDHGEERVTLMLPEELTQLL